MKPEKIMRFHLRVKTRTIFRILQFLLLFTVIAIAGLVFGIKYTERPEFCNTCHYMRPYYQAWKTSKHNNIVCVECHFEPGVLSTLEGKFKSITQLAKYVTKTEGTRPWAEISDKSCLRGGCHEKRLLEGKTTFGKIKFDHKPHLLEMRRGKKLRCTSCHSQIMVGTHMTVTTSTCYLCHFKDEPDGHALGGCLGCHRLPEKEIVIQGMQFNHAEYIRDGAACEDCHLNVTSGSGSVPRERCVSCHGEPERLKHYRDSRLMHRNHVTEHKVECALCHNEIEHGAVKMRGALVLQCNICHGNLHTAQRDLYAGTGARGVAGKPSPMFLARVNCESCHIVDKNSEKSHFTGRSLVVEEIACMKCHGTGVGGILPLWRKYVDDRIQDVERLFPAARAKLPGSGPDAGRLKKLYGDARYNYDLVRYGHGEHNIEYTRAVIDTVENSLRTVIDPKHPPARPATAPAASCTQLCHVTPPRKDILFQGKLFPHGRHSDAEELVCTDCHSAGKHKMTTISAKDCGSCHHRKYESECLRCHKNDVENVRAMRGKPFPHADHIRKAKLSCDSCHIADNSSRMIFRQNCVTCHEKKKPAAHLTDWRHLHGKASRETGAACSSCHKDTFCSSCHGMEMPHPDGWTGKTHGRQAYAQKNLCLKCHQTSGCVDCHRKTEHAAGAHKDCKSCHDPKTWNFPGAAATCLNCHKKQMSDKAPAKHQDCTGCHKPHVWKPAPQPGLCSECHSKQVSSAGAVPAMADCTICHSPHSWKFGGYSLCFDCHDGVGKDIAKNNIMPDCASCHLKHEWKIKSAKDTCGACHQDMPDHEGEPFDNCTDCHAPHTWKP